MTKTLMEGPRFESKPCARCESTGERPGGDCPTCHGAGSLLTKRGRAARSYMQSLLEKPASEVGEGEMIWFPVGGVKVASAVRRVELDVGPTSRIRLHGVRRMTNDDIAFTVAKNGWVTLAHTPDELEGVRVKVEAYQATLTNHGEVSRRYRPPGAKRVRAGKVA